MTHEFKAILHQASVHQAQGLKSVLATVVHLQGSSYRKPGVRMLISEHGELTGAVSGGCVENEIVRRAQTVFTTNQPKVMTYDGRYRLGCEGILYILLEPFVVSQQLISEFDTMLKKRDTFSITSYFKLEDDATGNYGSILRFKDSSQYTFDNAGISSLDTQGLNVYTQHLQPTSKLIIIGGEHDAVKLCQMASSLGWDIDVITSVRDPKQLSDFPGATSVTAQSPEMVDLQVDNETVVVLMTHNYVQDLKFLLKLAETHPKYVGILGSSKRREQLENDMLHYKEDLGEALLEAIYSPAGLDIGAITPEEIALSILSEILSVLRKTTPLSLRETKKAHHNNNLV